MIRLKDEPRLIYRDMEKLFEKEEGKRSDFIRGNKTIECRDIAGFEMEGLERTVRVVRYCEYITDTI